MESTYYGDYLNLKNILNAQDRKNSKAHDEMLFIIIHQTYELWFKQILFELDSIIAFFEQKHLPEADINKINARTERIIAILNLLNEQLPIIETMSPQDFLEFRDQLIPASGFQSIQFRSIEMKLGLKIKDRISFDQASILSRLNTEDQKIVQELDKKASLFDHLQNWLERTPFMQDGEFNFTTQYRKVVMEMLDHDEKIIKENFHLNQEVKTIELKQLQQTRDHFESLFDAAKYSQAGHKLSQKALLASLFIFLYRDEPLLYQPYRLLNNFIEIDECLTTWRYRHALMAQRILGMKIGTGGSSGHQYLKMATDQHRVFKDLFNLSSFLIPKTKLPGLPEKVKAQFQYNFKLSK